VDEAMAALGMAAGTRLDVIAEAQGWRLELSHPDQVDQVDPDPVQAASRWLIEQLADPEPALEPDFQLQRFGRPPTPPPAGERLITVDQTNRSVVVGEQLVVKWITRIEDAEHPALRTLHHLDEVGFDGVPATYGALTWSSPTSPTSPELPLAFVTAFLEGAVDGWQWCADALKSGSRQDFPAELGRLTGKLHVALGSPSSLLPLPMLAVGPAQVRQWHQQARQRLETLAEQIGELDGAPAGPELERSRQVPSEVLALHLKPMESAIDRLLEHSGRTPTQLIHGDLHVGQVLSWVGGLSVIDFDGSPVLGGRAASTRQPAARDVAQLLLSLDQVGRIVDRRSGYTRTDEINAWSRTARAEFLLAYRDELEQVERRDVLDTRLLPAFIVEQACRDLLYSARFLPRWAYATIDGLETILADLPEPIPTPAFDPQSLESFEAPEGFIPEP
jgi:maltokinase